MKRIRLTENRLRSLIREVINRIMCEQTLYHCSDGEMRPQDYGMFLSEYPDFDYGNTIYGFEVEGLNIADYDTTLSYIQKYDLRNFDEVSDDEWIGQSDNVWDFWQEIKAGKLSKEEAYERLANTDWNEVMEHPGEKYKFLSQMRSDGFDGYYFEFWDGNMYYYIFDANKCKPLGIIDEDDDF